MKGLFILITFFIMSCLHTYGQKNNQIISGKSKPIKLVVQQVEAQTVETQAEKKKEINYPIFTTVELKQLYKDAIDKKDHENIALLKEELSKRSDTKRTSQNIQASDHALKGSKVSSGLHQTKIGNYYALIIGIDNYKGAWVSLKNALRDAKAVENLLKSKYKFDHFRTLYDELATRKNIMQELSWLVKNVTENDNVLIYYSGHGDFKEELDKGYWVPADAKTKETYEFISNSDIQTYLNGIKSRHTLLISDACFSGDIFRGTNISVPFDQTTKYYEKVYELKSRQALTSGGVEPVTDGGRDGHSVFTYYLLEMLKRNEYKYYDAGQLFNDIKIPINNNAEQTPMLQPIEDTGDQGGQFIFIKKY